MARQVQNSAKIGTRKCDGGGDASQRLDKWLWFARVAKTRTLAAGLVLDGKVRLNKLRVSKPAQAVRAGDVITVSIPRGVRVLRVVDGGSRRGPASEAALLYDEIVALPSPRSSHKAEEIAHPGAEAGSGRPTKRERRELDRLRWGEAE